MSAGGIRSPEVSNAVFAALADPSKAAVVQQFVVMVRELTRSVRAVLPKEAVVELLLICACKCAAEQGVSDEDVDTLFHATQTECGALRDRKAAKAAQRKTELS